MTQTVFETRIPELKLLKRGKVRDVYEIDEHLLIVATDRLSAFDVILPDPIPDKGTILNTISLFWFRQMESILPNHVVTSDISDYPEPCRRHAEMLKGRSMLVKKADPLPIECIVRGYISGSGWKDYQASGSVCGIPLPEGLKESQQLPEPIFTPSTKAEAGEHDENIDLDATAELIGTDMASKIRDLSIAVYKKGSELARSKGIIIADTKFEFGRIGNDIVLIDEVLTPDSSRFWPLSSYAPGGGQQSFDKQFVRDYLISINWNKKPPAPKLPADVIEKTHEKYLEALNRLTT